MKLTPGKKSFKDTKGYSRVGGVLKSEATKKDLESKQKRINSFTPAQTRQVAKTVERNNNVPLAVKKGAVLNKEGDKGAPGTYKGDSTYKKIGNKKRRFQMPKMQSK